MSALLSAFSSGALSVPTLFSGSEIGVVTSSAYGRLLVPAVNNLVSHQKALTQLKDFEGVSVAFLGASFDLSAGNVRRSSKDLARFAASGSEDVGLSVEDIVTL